jgi:hypothetical protein
MKAILTNRGRLAATVLAATALLLGGTAGATAYAQGPLTGLFGSPASTQTAPTGVGGATGLPGFGLFKAVFAVFGAVRAQVPTIAAPIISQAVTDGTITAAEATQLTSWLAGQHTAMAGTGASTMTKTKPSAGEIAVLRKVFAAVLGQLATIAAPVLAAEVQNGDLTQAEADMITKVLVHLTAATSPGTGAGATAPSTPGLSAGAASGNLLATVETKVAAQVKKASHHHKHKHKAATRTHRAG